jgi:putative DNA primase/helicase
VSIDLNLAGPFNPSGDATDGAASYDMDAISEALRATAYSWVPETFKLAVVDYEGGFKVYRCADIRGGAPHKDGSCIIQTEGPNAGDWYDHQLADGGGPISTLKEHYNLSSKETLSFCAELAEKYGGGSYLRKEKHYGNGNGGAGPVSHSSKNIANADFLLSVATQGIAGTPVETYLKSRQITIVPQSPDMYFYPLATQPQNNRGYPTWIMRFADPHTGNYSGGIHRIFLADDGSRHIGADGLKPKMMLGPVEGAVIRFALPDESGTLGIGEGPESTLAAMQIYSIPGWSAASAGNFHKLAAALIARGPFPGVARLAVWSDGEAGGVEAAYALRDAARAVGMASDVYLPAGGDDFADDLQRGLAAAPAVEDRPPGQGIAAAQDIIPPAPNSFPRITSAQATVLVRNVERGIDGKQLSYVISQIIFGGLEQFDEQQALEGLRRKLNSTNKIINGMVKSLRGEKTVATKPAWVNHPDMQLSFDGEPKAIMSNVSLVLREAPEFRGAFGFDEFSGTVSALRKLPWEENPGKPCAPRECNDDDEIALLEWIQLAGIHAHKNAVFDAVQRVAAETKFHPVRDIFENLVWDKAARLDMMGVYCFGCEDTPYVRAVFPRWMISGVARIFEPGCKVDCMLILEGKQGLLKSTAIRTLAYPWFTDEMPPLGTPDAAIQIRGKWIIEISELESMSRAEVKTLNAFMSRTTDRFRPPYGRRAKDFDRQCIFAGSTNEGEYLKDPTGARRFWTVACSLINIPLLKSFKEQLWAEAVFRYRAKEKWWIDSDETELLEFAKVEAGKRFQLDEWENQIEVWVRGKSDVLMSDIFSDCLEIKDRSKWGRADQMRISAIMKRLGWTRKKVNGWRYLRPGHPLLADQRLKAVS